MIIILFLAACEDGYNLSHSKEIDNAYEVPYTQATVPFDEHIEQDDNTPVNVFFEELFIHWDDGVTQFASRMESNTTVLYAIENYGSQITQLAVFHSLNVEHGYEETPWCRPQNIFQLDVVDDWIILSAGEIQGSMRNFFGDLHRVRRDGSGREAFHLDTNEHRFVVINGWIYNHIWCHQGCHEEGWIRIRPDGTDREYLGDFIRSIILFGDDGYIYGANAVSGESNLARWLPESKESITLFLASDTPTFDDFFSRVSYSNIVTDDEHVYFTVFVFGEWYYAEPNGWRPLWESLYEADFKVGVDGSGLTLLYERLNKCNDSKTNTLGNSQLSDEAL